MIVIAIIGTKVLALLYLWLASAIVASLISDRKGYGPNVGLAMGIVLSVVGVVIWLLVPAKPDSRWKLQGPFGRGGQTVAEARAKSAAPAEKES
jgi:hypothetical protein